jgi:hypothetical protein
VVVVSSTQITATFAIGAGAALGNRNITVTTAGGTTTAVSFAVLPPAPTITSITPAPMTRGAVNQAVTVNGTNLGTAASFAAAIQVLDGGGVNVTSSISLQAGSFTAAAAQLKWNWTIPTTLTAGTYTMIVTTPSGTTSRGFTVN